MGIIFHTIDVICGAQKGKETEMRLYYDENGGFVLTNKDLSNIVKMDLTPSEARNPNNEYEYNLEQLGYSKAIRDVLRYFGMNLSVLKSMIKKGEYDED